MMQGSCSLAADLFEEFFNQASRLSPLAVSGFCCGWRGMWGHSRGDATWGSWARQPGGGLQRKCHQ